MVHNNLNSNCTFFYIYVDFLVHFQRIAQFADLEAMQTLKFVSKRFMARVVPYVPNNRHLLELQTN